MKIFLTLLGLLLLPFTPASAQTVTPPLPTAALVCAYNSSPPAITTGNFAYVQCDASGHIISSSSFAGVSFTATGGNTSTALTNRATMAGVRFDVHSDFGLACDGTTNDTTKFSAMRTAVNLISVPVTLVFPGSCLIDPALYTFSTQVTFEGATSGAGLKLAATSTLPSIWLYFPNAVPITFRGITLNLNDATVSSGIASATNFATGSSFTFDRSSIINGGAIGAGAGVGMVLLNGAGVTSCDVNQSTFSFTTASSQKSSGINLGGVSANQAMHCKVTKNTLVNGNLYYQGDYADISGNEVYGFGAGAGIVVEDGPETDTTEENYPHHLTVNRNNIHDGVAQTDFSGDRVGGMELGFPDTVANDNTIANVGAQAIKVYAANIQVIGNHAKNVGKLTSTDHYQSCYIVEKDTIFDGSGSFFDGNSCSDDGTGGTTYGYSDTTGITGVKLGTNDFQGSKGAYDTKGAPIYMAAQYENKIINPCGTINQRKGTGTNTSGFGPDQWRDVNVPVTMTVSTVATANGKCPTYINILSTTQATPAATDINALYQNIAVRDVRDFNYGATSSAQQGVLAFCASTNVAPPFTGSYFVQNVVSGHSYVGTYTITANAGSWQCFSYRVVPDTVSVGAVLANTGLRVGFNTGSGATELTSTLNSWAVGTFYGASTDAGLISQANSSTLSISNVRWLAAGADEGWSPQTFSDQLAAAQRFYRTSFAVNTAPAQSGGVTGAVTAVSLIALSRPFVYIPLSPPMNSAPTVTTYNPSAANANWRDVTAGADIAVTVLSNDPSGVSIGTSANVTNQSDSLRIHYAFDAGL